MSGQGQRQIARRQRQAALVNHLAHARQDMIRGFRQHAADYPGLVVPDVSNRRNYPYGESMGQITGSMMAVPAAERQAAHATH